MSETPTYEVGDRVKVRSYAISRNAEIEREGTVYLVETNRIGVAIDGGVVWRKFPLASVNKL